MEFRETIARRRMVRNYSPDPVDMETLQAIAETALRAPSAGYSQGTAVIVVIDPGLRNEIASLAAEAEYVAAGFDPWISAAPGHIVIAVSEKAYHERYNEPDKLDDDGAEIEWPVPYWWVDAGASLMAVLLAAVDAGLAAGFLGVHNMPELARLLEMPEEYRPIGVVTVGHPAPDRRSSSLARGPKPRASVVHIDRWNSD